MSQQQTVEQQLMLTQQILESKYGKNNQKVIELMQSIQQTQEKQRYVQLLEKYDPELLINPDAGATDELIKNATKQGILQPVSNIATLSRALDASYHHQQIQPLTLNTVYDRSVYNQALPLNPTSDAERRLNQMISKNSDEEINILRENKQLKTAYKTLRTEQNNDELEIMELKLKILEGQKELTNDKEYTELLKQRTQWQKGTCNQIEKELKSTAN